MMRCLTVFSVVLFSLLVPGPSAAQGAKKVDKRLSYIFVKPTLTPLEQVMDGLHVLDGEFVQVIGTPNDSVAEIVGRVRDKTWRRNAEVVGTDSLHQQDFGPLQSCLRADPRFRVLAIPASCSGCEGDRRIVFLAFTDTTGYLVGTWRKVG